MQLLIGNNHMAARCLSDAAAAFERFDKGTCDNYLVSSFFLFLFYEVNRGVNACSVVSKAMRSPPTLFYPSVIGDSRLQYVIRFLQSPSRRHSVSALLCCTCPCQLQDSDIGQGHLAFAALWADIQSYQSYGTLCCFLFLHKAGPQHSLTCFSSLHTTGL